MCVPGYMCVYLSVCLLILSRNATKFLCMLHVAMTWSSGINVIRCVLPVFGMTSLLDNEPCGVSCVFLSGSRVDSNQIWLNDKDQQIHTLFSALEAKSAIYDCLFLFCGRRYWPITLASGVHTLVDVFVSVCLSVLCLS